MRCHNCGSELENGVMFCRDCGAKVGPIVRFCRDCGAQIPEGSKFCTQCGSTQDINESTYINTNTRKKNTCSSKKTTINTLQDGL